MPRLVSVDDDFNLPDVVNIRDTNLPDRLGAGQLSATFVPKWKATTAYLAGDPVLNPSGDVVTAKVNFTSGASYDAANWNASATAAAVAAKANTADVLPKWTANTAYTLNQRVISPSGETVRAKAAFTSGSLYDSTNWEYGTITGGSNIPTIKSPTDTRPGVWEYTHNSTTGYIFHLLAGANFGAPAAILAIGNDNGDGTSILLPNKAGGKAIVIDQRSTVTSATAYGLHATQSSSAAPLVRLEQNVDGAAAALQLLAFGTPTAGQHLLYVGDPTGQAGRIMAGTGIINWNRDIKISNKSSGEAASYLELSTSSAANSANTKKSFKHSDADYAFGATGSAGVYYPYKVAHSSSAYAFQTASNLTAADPLNPLPSEVGTWVTQFSIGHNTLAFFGATKVKKTGWSVATGTATRTTFDTTTVTLPELAQRVKALIDDLHATAGYGLLQS
jgi:hypothetical protein